MEEPEFQEWVENSTPEPETPSLSTLVPQAYALLERAMKDGSVPAARARIALDILKASASLEGEAEGESTLEARLKELDALGYESVSD